MAASSPRRHGARYRGGVPDDAVSGPLDLIRRAAIATLKRLPDELDQLDAATLSGPGMDAIAADPELSAATARVNQANIVLWLNTNVTHPGEPVPANTSRELMDYFRNAVRRGLDATGFDAFRTGQNAAWRQWMLTVFSLADGLEQARDALEISTATVNDFVDRTLHAVLAAIAAEREELLRGSQADKREIIELIVAGQPVAPERASRLLGYHLDAPHTAFIVWTAHADPDSAVLADLARDIAATWRAECTLTVVPSTGSLWVWVDSRPGDYPAGRIPSGVQVAVGSHAHGLQGFRRSHMDAATVQRMLARLESPGRFATSDEVALVNLATGDPAAAADFMHRTLGALASADPALRAVMRTFLRGGSSVTRTAQTLHMHRNTVVRHLAKAEELLPHPLADAVPTDIAVALDIRHWGGGADLRTH